MFTEKQKELLKYFGSRCYWHGEDTGDYDMQSVDELLDDLWQEFSLTPLAVDGALVTVNESGEITCKVCGRGMRAKTPRH